MATGRPALEELERAFRDKIAEMRGLIVLRQSSAASASDAERARWLEDLTQIEERVAGVEKLAEGLAQEVDEELRQLEQARDIWRTTFFEQKSELEALYEALPPTMRPASSYSSSTASTASSAASTAPLSSSSAANSSSTAATAPPTSTATGSTAPQAQQQAPQGVARAQATRRTMASSSSSSAAQQQQPASKRQRVGTSKSIAAPPAAPAAPIGGALKPRHVTEAEVEKLPKYMRGRLTAAKCNEALDELARLIDNRAKLLQLPQSAVSRLKPPQSDQYLRAQTLQLAARKADPPLPKRFVSEKDFTESKILRLDTMGKMLFTTLRHLGVIREFLCDNVKCFTLL